MTGSNSSMISCLTHLLGKDLSLNDLDKLQYFFGIEFISRYDGLFLNQTRYAIHLLEQEYMTTCKPISTTLDPNKNLHKIPSCIMLLLIEVLFTPYNI